MIRYISKLTLYFIDEKFTAISFFSFALLKDPIKFDPKHNSIHFMSLVHLCLNHCLQNLNNLFNPDLFLSKLYSMNSYDN